MLLFVKRTDGDRDHETSHPPPGRLDPRWNLKKRFVTLQNGMQQFFESEPQIIEQITIKAAVLKLLQCAIVQDEHVGIGAKPVAGLLDQRFVYFRR